MNPLIEDRYGACPFSFTSEDQKSNGTTLEQSSSECVYLPMTAPVGSDKERPKNEFAQSLNPMLPRSAPRRFFAFVRHIPRLKNETRSVYQTKK
jgi:hypothetical protein